MIFIVRKENLQNEIYKTHSGLPPDSRNGTGFSDGVQRRLRHGKALEWQRFPKGHRDKRQGLTGGDTLLQCMNCVGIKELEPVCEVEKGVVLARFTYRGCTRYVITKSGGFGHEKLLLDLADRIAAEQT